jgi:putative membrane protein
MDSELPALSELILRDHLALDRTRLANERTLLAYIRTAFMLVVAGVTALKLFVETPAVVITAWLFVGLGLLVLFIGIWRFMNMRILIIERLYQTRTDGRSPISP